VALAARSFILLIALSLSACYSTSVRQAPDRVTLTSHHQLLVYNVRANDTLYSIGKRFGLNYRIIARRNHLHTPYQIYIGQRLYMNRTAPDNRHHPLASAISHAARKKQIPSRRSGVKGKEAEKGKVKTPRKHSLHRKAVANTRVRLLWPVKGPITSRFGRRGGRMHDGIDIGVKNGTAVHAAASGVVVYSGSRLSGYGNLIIIRHRNNLFTAYAHNQRNLVRKGAKVRAGDVIARSGHSGRATGPHLHFEVRQSSTPVNPLAYLPH